MGINNESADTRECTTIIAFYNGNRSRNVRVIANIALDLIKYRCRKGDEGVKDLCVNEDTFGVRLYCALHAFITWSLRLKGLPKRARLQITRHLRLVRESLCAIAASAIVSLLSHFLFYKYICRNINIQSSRELFYELFQRTCNSYFITFTYSK